MEFFVSTSKIADASPDKLGGKGYGLYEMGQLGMPVPPAIIIPPSACLEYREDPTGVMAQVEAYYDDMYASLIAHIGYRPLVSVRSGAKVSMPGMMDTILNVGIDDDTRQGYVKALGAEVAEDCEKRLIEMYSDVVHSASDMLYEHCNTAAEMRQTYWTFTGGETFPDAKAQLLHSVEAVFRSWDNPRAVAYRDMHGIPHDLGTGVVIQAMVFGNRDEHSCTGVLFTRNPSTGEKGIYGEFLVNAQGEDVVAGTATPDPIHEMSLWNNDCWEKLVDLAIKMENHRKDMQDMEFTVESGTLWLLQTRNGKRSAEAALKIVTDMVLEGLIPATELASRVTLQQYLTATSKKLSDSFDHQPTGKGLPASTGVAVGRAVFSNEAAINCTDPCILIAKETTPDDVVGMNASVGILTSTGGATSHAAVVARGMDKVCVVGATELQVNASKATATMDGVTITAGDWVTLNGSTGHIWLGQKADLEDGDNTEVATNFRKMLVESSEKMLTVTSLADLDGSTKPVVVVAHAMSDDDFKQVVDQISGHGVIDLRPALQQQDDKLSWMPTMFDRKPSETDDMGVFAKLKYLSKAQKLVSNSKLRVILPKGMKKTASMKFEVLDTVSTLEDLIMADGAVLAGGEINASGDVLAKVKALKEAAGETLMPVKLSSEFAESVTATPTQIVQEALK